MSDQDQIVAQKAAPPKYPNSALFGFCCGATLEAQVRKYTMEPLAARPLQYLKMGLIFGGAIWYWDYLRRVMIEDTMKGEEKMRYYKNLRAINFNMRVGDEDEISNLTEYLASTTTRM